MRSFSIKPARPYGIMVVVTITLLMAVFGIILAAKAHAKSATEEEVAAGGGHLISIHDNGTTRGIITKAGTLREAFAQAGITIDSHDLVEPGLDQELVASQYDVNVYRARPVTIVDGSIRKRVITPYQTTEQIAKQAEVVLQDEDITQLRASVDIKSHSAELQMTIDRAVPLTLVLYGKRVQTYTQGATVGEMLAAKKIELGKNEMLSVAKNAPITAGMTVELWREGKQVITEEEDVDFPVEQIRDSARPVGFKEVKTEGEKGKRTVSYEIVMKNGKEVSRTEIRSVTVKEPKKQIEIIGTKLSLPPGSHEDWMRTAGMDPSNYGYINAIFAQESGWNPAARNPSGLYVGLGQTNPAKLSSACPSWQSDPICQIRFFDGYAKSRYGSWHAAYVFKFGEGGSGGRGWW